MEYGNIENLKFIVIPILIIIFIIFGMMKKEKILKAINWKSTVFMSTIKSILISSGALLVFLAFLSPQKLKEEEKVIVNSNDLYALIDVSKSMLAKDTYPNRLEKSKIELKEILNSLQGDRIGIIPFSDTAYIQMPLTEDYFMAMNYIDAIDSDLISGGGTELLSGLKIANESFEKVDAKNKNLIIFSDGGEYNQEILNFVKDNNIRVFVFGVGTDEGSTIETSNGFIKDEKGNIVITKLNDDFLKTLTRESNGKFYELNNLSEGNVKRLIKDLGTLEKNEKRENKIKIYDRYYFYPLSIGLILILLGYFLRNKKKEEEYV